MRLSVEMDSLYGGYRIDCYSIVVRRSDDWVWFELFNIETQHMQKGGTFQGLNTGSNPVVDHTKLARAGGSSSEAHLYWRRWIKPTGIIFFDPALRAGRPLFFEANRNYRGRIESSTHWLHSKLSLLVPLPFHFMRLNKFVLPPVRAFFNPDGLVSVNKR